MKEEFFASTAPIFGAGSVKTCYQLTLLIFPTHRMRVAVLRDGISCLGVLVETWLILPVVICLSQRLSHACLSISQFKAKLRMAH